MSHPGSGRPDAWKRLVVEDPYGRYVALDGLETLEMRVVRDAQGGTRDAVPLVQEWDRSDPIRRIERDRRTERTRRRARPSLSGDDVTGLSEPTVLGVGALDASTVAACLDAAALFGATQGCFHVTSQLGEESQEPDHM